ncbi:hypothetical protein F1880_010069 [Penicillium rolfsii]|nr:hypothetical protein F1880_010069 [Penicillium rolfsii]
MRLDHLPTEIVLEIVPFLTKHDLAQLVLACKSWNSLFIPHLYHHVMLPLNDYCRCSFGHLSGRPNLPVRRFTMALIENPSLALLIRSLELYPSDCEGKWRNRPPLQPLMEDKYRLSMLPHGDSKSKYRRKFHAWRRDLKTCWDRQDWYRPYRHEDAWLALLLVQVKNLEKFAMELPEEWNHLNEEVQLKTSVHFERVIQWASNPSLGVLTRLSHVSLTNGPAFWETGTAVNAMPLHRLIPFLRIPSLRKLYVKDACDRLRLKLPRDLAPQLTHLDLEAPKGRLPNLPGLLERCTSLQSFTIDKAEWGDGHGHDRIGFSSIYQPLLGSKHSLRHLNITFRSFRSWDDAEIPWPVFFGSLVEFPNLQSVHMHCGNLLIVLESAIPGAPSSLRELLPRSLEHFFLEDCLIQNSWLLCKELEKLLIHFSETVPLLKTLYLRYAAREQVFGQGYIDCARHWSKWRLMEPDPVLDSRLLDLQDRFRGLGVDFQVIKPDVPVKFPQDSVIRKKWLWETSGRLR